MTDVVDKATRSRMMSGIRGVNTRPELRIRKALHARGFRFRLHAKELPGKPDLVFPRYHAAVFIHGCFWHGHDCRYFKVPQSRTEFWLGKIGQNRARDARQHAALREAGWRTLVIWECATRTKVPEVFDRLIDHVADWLINGSSDIQMDETGWKLLPCSMTVSVTTSKV